MKQSIQYESLKAGYELPPASYEISAEVVSRYLEAVDESGNLYRQPDNPKVLTGNVPPMAMAAYAMKTLSQNLSLPPGAIHVTQEIECLKILQVGSSITCYARVSRKQERSNLCLLTIDLSVFNQNQEQVLSGKTSVVLPVAKLESADR